MKLRGFFLLVSLLPLLLAQAATLVQELQIANCDKPVCRFQHDAIARHAVIHQGVIVIPGSEASQNSRSGRVSVLYVYEKHQNAWKMTNKITTPMLEGRNVDGTLYISYSLGNLLVGFVRNVPAGAENLQQLLMYDKSKNWNITKEFPIHWNFEQRPPEGTLRTDVRMTAVAGDHLIHGQWYWHSYGFYVDTPRGASKANGWDYTFGGMNTVVRKQIATGFYNGKPSFLQTIHTHSYVLFDPIVEGNRVKWQNSLYGTNSFEPEDWGMSSAIDRTAEIVVQAVKQNGTNFLSIWDKPRNGRGWSYIADDRIDGKHAEFGRSVAVYGKYILVTDGSGKVLVYQQITTNRGTRYELRQILEIVGLAFEKL
jgi:hypothetical protein